MKNLKKISRENLKSVKGGITRECAKAQSEASACFDSSTECEAYAGVVCPYFCNKWCF
jgi:hypothetical protein